MKLRAALVAIGLMVLPLLPQSAQAKDDLVIGVAQFPSSLHPAIDAEVVKAYVLGFAIRPITAFDKDWKNSCLLCTELPTIENGTQPSRVTMPPSNFGARPSIATAWHCVGSPTDATPWESRFFSTRPLA